MADTDQHRQQDLYWKQLIELKVGLSYMRRYRDQVGKQVRALEVLKAITSSAGIGAWAIWNKYAFIWAMIIAASQVADALKNVFTFTKTHKAASEHTVILDSLFIDAQLEWENIFTGRYTDDEIMNRRHKLMKLQHDAERKNFPEGLGEIAPLFALAQQDAKHYFEVTYGV